LTAEWCLRERGKGASAETYCPVLLMAGAGPTIICRKKTSVRSLASGPLRGTSNLAGRVRYSAVLAFRTIRKGLRRFGAIAARGAVQNLLNNI